MDRQYLDEVRIRPIRPDDEPAMARFHATLSERSVYLRYFHMMRLDARTAHERLARICRPDASETVLVAEHGDGIVAVGRLVKSADRSEGEFAVVISDAEHGHGLGTALLQRLIETGRSERLKKIVAEILPENDPMLHICKLAGFELKHRQMDHVVKAELEL